MLYKQNIMFINDMIFAQNITLIAKINKK